jgi:hypothetical protein
MYVLAATRTSQLQDESWVRATVKRGDSLLLETVCSGVSPRAPAERTALALDHLTASWRRSSGRVMQTPTACDRELG